MLTPGQENGQNYGPFERCEYSLIKVSSSIVSSWRYVTMITSYAISPPGSYHALSLLLFIYCSMLTIGKIWMVFCILVVKSVVFVMS